MSNCTDCIDELGLPVGSQGEQGLPAFLPLSFTGGGSPDTDNTAAFVEIVGSRFLFSTNNATPFTSIRINIWVNGGVGAYRIRDLISGNVLYTNSNITSTSSINVETATGLEIYNVTNAIIVIEFKSGAGQTITAGAATLAYE